MRLTSANRYFNAGERRRIMMLYSILVMTKLIAFISLMVVSFAVQAQKNIDGLIKAEKNFAAYAVSNSVKEAFLKFLDSNGIVFDQGKAVNGIQLWNAREKSTGVLNWHPEYAEIAASADFGYTTGPWTFQAAGLPDSIIARGQYITVWHITNNGEWKFLIDLGINHSIKVADKAFKEISATKIKTKTATAKLSLMAAEQAFLQAYRQKGNKAYSEFLSKISILNRNKLLPATTTIAQQKMLDSLSFLIQYTIEGSGLSLSGDLGYVYGNTTLDGKNDNYMRIWRREMDSWKIAVEVLHH